ncbi:hypothetical protein [Streptomyces sp. PanSC9]|uniref:hypothetical protein n=1 Tax=Streptomyces sp. PanSC9 TaxID=1520461 RepID=UPI000F491E01|nr:hypothetical protein [Streptomyces sp. PanSC9]ROP44245.1 hypothetical protein EDD94_8036 [Streptomyces sp. PanSC9]
MRKSEEAERQEPAGVEREAAGVEAALGLAGQEPPSLHVPAVRAPFPKGLVRLAASAPGREQLRLMFAEHPGLVLWLENRMDGQHILAAVELEHAGEAPEASVAEEAAREAGPAQAAFRRRWASERRRDYDEMQAHFASPAHIAAKDQAHAAMMDAFHRRNRP